MVSDAGVRRQHPGQPGQHAAQRDQPARSEALHQTALERREERLQHDQQRERHLQRGRRRASAPPSGLVNSVQTYCGLEIAIMQIRPRPKLDPAGRRMGERQCDVAVESPIGLILGGCIGHGKQAAGHAEIRGRHRVCP